MNIITLTEVSTNRRIHINLNNISHWFDATDLDTGAIGAIIYLRSNFLYCVQERATEIVELISESTSHD